MDVLVEHLGRLGLDSVLRDKDVGGIIFVFVLEPTILHLYFHAGSVVNVRHYHRLEEEFVFTFMRNVADRD